MADRPASATHGSPPEWIMQADPRSTSRIRLEYRAVSKQVKHSRLTALTNDRTRAAGRQVHEKGAIWKLKRPRNDDIRDLGLRSSVHNETAVPDSSARCSTCDETHPPLGGADDPATAFVIFEAVSVIRNRRDMGRPSKPGSTCDDSLRRWDERRPAQPQNLARIPTTMRSTMGLAMDSKRMGGWMM
ncbi:hypothetical protein D9611_010569 [Ephemerocybe angulata]|uniref:Uncharacterized protein n=1 Tax=Ephemerocybe angulata TaxID=980116 RepID=A0A8H5FB51_9AGAR|nr:hypothetical protein D9611_010569 [Tulosesus angulatus]